MSALGQKQTCAAQQSMSAIHPIARKRTPANGHVRFTPRKQTLNAPSASQTEIGPPMEGRDRRARACAGGTRQGGSRRSSERAYLFLPEPGPTRLFAVCASMVVRETLSIWPITSSTTARCSAPGGSGLGIVLLLAIFKFISVDESVLKSLRPDSMPHALLASDSPQSLSHTRRSRYPLELLDVQYGDQGPQRL